jgi:hypothetical protein
MLVGVGRGEKGDRYCPEEQKTAHLHENNGVLGKTLWIWADRLLLGQPRENVYRHTNTLQW